MNHRLPFVLSLLLATPLLQAQSNSAPKEAFIEVIADAEQKVVPDEIYIAIDLRERGTGNNKVTIEQQEVELKKAVTGLGIDAANLTLSNAMADLVYRLFRDDEVIARKVYELKVSSAEQVRNVFRELDLLQIENARIFRTAYSKEKELREQMYAQAVETARSKADKMLGAVGETRGRLLMVSDRSDRIGRSGDRDYAQRMSSVSIRSSSDKYVEPLDIAFTQVVVSAQVYVMFAVAQP